MTKATEKTERTIPRLASDIARSWLSVALALPLLLAVPVVATFVPNLGVEGLDDPAVLYSGGFYLSWTAFCIVSIAVTLVTFRRADSEQLHRWLSATRAPRGRLRHLWWAFNGGGAIGWAAGGSLVALGALLGVALSGREMPFLFVVAGVAVVPSSLAMIVVAFAVSHARTDSDGALRFPGPASPVFADYLYLSIQLTATFGTSDVEVTTTRLRRAVSVHSVLAFAYNAFVVALLVSAILNAVPRG